MAIRKKYLILIPLMLVVGAIAYFVPTFFLGRTPSLDESGAAQGIDWARATPNTILVNEPTTVTITTQVKADPTLIPTSVNLIRCDSTGKGIATLRTLYDDGTRGDVTARDNIFSAQITLNEAAVGKIYLRISAAYKGILKRILSNTFTINVNITASRLIEDTLRSFSNALINNDMVATQDLFAEEGREKNISTLQSLSPQFRQLLGQAIGEGLQYPISASEDATSLSVQIRLVDGSGQSHYGTVVLVKDPDGNWKIKKW